MAWDVVDQQPVQFGEAPNGHADIIVLNPAGRAVAVVEVKNRRDLTPEVAVQLRRNLVVHGLVPPGPYFLLISQDVGYLWLASAGPLPHDPPALEFEVQPVILRYLTWFDGSRRLTGSALELVVAQWLDDLAAGRGPQSESVEAKPESFGFVTAIAGASIVANGRA